MSTRAVYTFIDKRERNELKRTEYHVYKHCDGYPSGAAEWIDKALPYAWPLPRYEACEFSTAFIAANKTKCGDVYLTKHYTDHGDLEFRYEISLNDNRELYITAYKVDYCTEGNDEDVIFTGTLAEFCVKAKSL